jgi:hypothetical protein
MTSNLRSFVRTSTRITHTFACAAWCLHPHFLTISREHSVPVLRTECSLLSSQVHSCPRGRQGGQGFFGLNMLWQPPQLVLILVRAAPVLSLSFFSAAASRLATWSW